MHKCMSSQGRWPAGGGRWAEWVQETRAHARVASRQSVAFKKHSVNTAHCFVCMLAQAAVLQGAEERLQLREQVHHRNLQHAVAQLLAECGRLQHVKQVAHPTAGRVWAVRGEGGWL